jgi:PEP-CTERM motif
MKFKQLAVVATLLLGSSLTHAASPIFLDDFNSYPADQFNWVPASNGWAVSPNGTVDIHGTGGVFDLIPGNGSYVDLDGTTLSGGLFSNNVNLIGGTTYTLSFDLAGSHRGSAETVNVNFGSTAASYSLDSADPFSTRILNFTPGSDGSYSFSYLNVGGDNVGALLDNVSVSAVPEPETYAMLLAGLGLVGFISRRRRKTA